MDLYISQLYAVLKQIAWKCSQLIALKKSVEVLRETYTPSFEWNLRRSQVSAALKKVVW